MSWGSSKSYEDSQEAWPHNSKSQKHKKFRTLEVRFCIQALNSFYQLTGRSLKLESSCACFAQTLSIRQIFFFKICVSLGQLAHTTPIVTRQLSDIKSYVGSHHGLNSFHLTPLLYSQPLFLQWNQQKNERIQGNTKK